MFDWAQDDHLGSILKYYMLGWAWHMLYAEDLRGQWFLLFEPLFTIAMVLWIVDLK